MTDRLIRELRQGQNPDGGWGYDRGGSWTEPTCLALLALGAWGGPVDAQTRSREWLLRNQLKDGGWGPEPSIPISTWVTSLAVLAMRSNPSVDPVDDRAIHWIKSQVGIQRSSLDEIRRWFTAASRKASYPQGWSFFPGTASWLMPTALAIVALAKSSQIQRDPALAERVASGRRFLLSRRCQDGGWNHGGSFARGEGAASYPETTGVGLLAFQGTAPVELDRSLELAENWLLQADSIEAQSWIRIALSAHGRDLSPQNKANRHCRSHYERSLWLLAEASQSGKNQFATAVA